MYKNSKTPVFFTFYAAKVQQKMHICKNFAQKFTFRCKNLANRLHFANVASRRDPLKVGGALEDTTVRLMRGRSPHIRHSVPSYSALGASSKLQLCCPPYRLITSSPHRLSPLRLSPLRLSPPITYNL